MIFLKTDNLLFTLRPFMIKKLYIFVVSVLLLSGCIFEDRSKCSDTYLKFTYYADDEGEKGANLIGDYMSVINGYVFDSKTSKYVSDFKLEKNVFTSVDGYPLILPDGDYRIVCWGNVLSKTLIKIGEGINDCYLSHPEYSGVGSIITTHDRLYYGSHNISVRKNVFSENEFKMSGAHITILFRTKGWTFSNKPIFEIKNVTPEYNFDRGLLNMSNANYRIESTIISKNTEYEAACHFLKFEINNPIVIHIFSGSMKLTSFELGKFLKDNNVELGDKNEIIVPIEISLNGMKVVIKLLNWDDEDIKPGV